MPLVNGSPIGLLLTLTYSGITDPSEPPVTPPVVPAGPTTWIELTDVVSIWVEVEST